MRALKIFEAFIFGTIYFITDIKEMMKKSKLEKIAKKITPMKVSKDDIGNYLHYCTFGCHYGVIGPIKAQDCIIKNCNHYRRYREEK